MQSVVFGIMIMGEQEIFMNGFFFQKINVGSHVWKNKFLPYKLIGNAAYPMWPWFYFPFKGEKA
jgi:hypothetical protein